MTKNLYWACCIALVIQVACGHEESRSIERAPVQDWDGETLYRGLILGHGPVADVIPEVREQLKFENYVAEPERVAQIMVGMDLLVSEVKAIDGELFARFKRAMTSGNQLDIKQGLEEAAQVTRQATTRMPGYKELIEHPQSTVPAASSSRAPSIKAGPGGPPACCGPTVCAWALATAVAIHAFVAITSWGAVYVAGYVYAATEFWGPGLDVPGGSGNALLREQMIDSIARRLAVRSTVEG